MCNALAPSSFQFLLWGKDSEIYTSLSHPKPLTQAVHFITARLGTPFAERPKQSGRDSKAFLAKQLSKRSAGSNSQTDEENPTPIPPRQHNVVLLHQFFFGGGGRNDADIPFCYNKQENAGKRKATNTLPRRMTAQKATSIRFGGRERRKKGVCAKGARTTAALNTRLCVRKLPGEFAPWMLSYSYSCCKT